MEAKSKLIQDEKDSQRGYGGRMVQNAEARFHYRGSREGALTGQSDPQKCLASHSEGRARYPCARKRIIQKAADQEQQDSGSNSDTNPCSTGNEQG